MATKHQLASYRIRKGVKYKGYCDRGDFKEIKQTIRELRAKGVRCFYEKGPKEEAYWRIFIKAEKQEKEKEISSITPSWIEEYKKRKSEEVI